MFTKGETSKALNRVIKDIHSNPEDYNFTKDEFGISFALADSATFQKFYDETYFTISMAQNTIVYNPETTVEVTGAEDRPIAICGDNFPAVSEAFQSTAETLAAENYCAVNSNFTLRGNIFSDYMKFISLKVTR